jgi:hypothetical protein
MSAMNLKKMLFQSVFLSNPVQESDLNIQYNYLPYKGAAAWKYKLFVKVNKFELKVKLLQITQK